jgi:hypothetical protein
MQDGVATRESTFSKQLRSGRRNRPIGTAFRGRGEACEVCPLVGKLMGTHERGYGFVGSGATTAMDVG